jgi:hypothetical protein
MATSLTDFSNGLTAAVEKAGTSTVLVDARKRYPASGIALAEDLVLTADGKSHPWRRELFEALKKRLESLLRSVFPTWTDHQLINFGNMLVEMFCFVGDTLGFNQDANARESRIRHVCQQGSLQPAQGHSQYPSFVVARAWDSNVVRFMWLAGIFLKIAGYPFDGAAEVFSLR